MLIRRLFFTVVVVGGLVFAIATLARFSDGPVGPFPGGPLQGEITRGPEPPCVRRLRAPGSRPMSTRPRSRPTHARRVAGPR